MKQSNEIDTKFNLGTMEYGESAIYKYLVDKKYLRVLALTGAAGSYLLFMTISRNFFQQDILPVSVNEPEPIGIQQVNDPTPDGWKFNPDVSTRDKQPTIVASATPIKSANQSSTTKSSEPNTRTTSSPTKRSRKKTPPPARSNPPGSSEKAKAEKTVKDVTQEVSLLITETAKTADEIIDGSSLV